MPAKHHSSRRLPTLASLDKAARGVLEASDLLAISSERLVGEEQRPPLTRVIDRQAALRTHDALRQTQSMLEQASAILQKAHGAFAPLGTVATRL